MRRFIYSPEVQVYIRSDEANKVFDVSKDIISGSVIRRLDAVSNASVTLQNKFGLYTRKFKPMDRIAIFMSRVGSPMLVFTGYLDEAPFYQMFPAPVTIQASCTLKLLQNTYFDPGLPFMTQWFTKFGWLYDPSSGTITDPFMGFGNFDQKIQDKFTDGNLGNLIAAALNEIGGWPKNHIFIRTIPGEFKNTLGKLMKAEALEYKEDYQRVVDRMAALLGVGTQDNTLPGDDKIITGGNASAVQLASLAKEAGFKGDGLVTAVAVALAESSGISTNMNYNSNATYDVGFWQINTVHTSGGGGGLPAPPAGDFDQHLVQWNKIKGSVPAGVKAFVENFSIRSSMRHKLTRSHLVVAASTRGQPTRTKTTRHIWQPRQAVDVLVKRRGTGDTEGLNVGTEWTDTTSVTNPKGKGATLGQVNISSGANLTGHPIQNKVILFDRILAGAFGGALTVGTGTNHNRLTVDGNVSDHYTGEATDIVSAGGHSLNGSEGSINPTLTKLGRVALQMIGYTQEEAFKIEGGLFTKDFPNGCRIQIIFNTTQGGNHYNHLHVGIKGNLPDSITKGETVPGGAAGAGDPQTQQGQETQNIETIARTAAWFTQTLPSSDALTAMSLSGKRALANDMPLFDWISTMCKAGGRRFCSMPNGDFLAFFPDYFKDFERTPYFIIRPIEIVDLQIQVSDRDLFTHVFATGTQFSPTIDLLDRMVSMVASVEEPAFNMFINVEDGKKTAKQQKGKKKSKKKKTNDLNVWKGAIPFLQRYGARPFPLDLPEIRHPVLLWMAAWLEFQKHWANQFSTDAEFTFMPELLPGGIVNFDNKITMFVESVTHTFDMEGGFKTSAELNSPASVNKNDKRFGGMVLAGGNFGVADALKEDSTIAKDAGPPPVRTIGGRAVGD